MADPRAKPTPEMAAVIAGRLERTRTRVDGGKLCVFVPGHPLARPNGWAVAARWVLAERWAAQGVTAPRCEVVGCGRRGLGRRMSWSAQRTQRVGALPAVVVWFLDGDHTNLDVGNLLGVCASCAQRGHTAGRLARGDDGRFSSPSRTC